MKLVADRAERIQSSLRDEMVWRDGRPWVETHGDLRRSLCDQGPEPCRLVEGTAGCHGQGVFDRAVLCGERMSEARVTPSARSSCLWL